MHGRIIPKARKLSRRRFCSGLAGASSVSLLASTLPGPALAQGYDEVSVQLNWLKLVENGGHFAALEKGFFRDERLNVEIQAGGPGIDSIMLTADGRAMIGDRDSTGLILARARGIPVRGFAASYQSGPACLISLQSKPIRTLKDVVGKTIAAPIQIRAILGALLKRVNVSPDSFTLVPTGGDPSILATGQVDGYFGWATHDANILQRRGFKLVVVMDSAMGNPVYPQVFFATEETLAEKKSVLTRWLRAEKKGWDYFAHHPDEIARLMVSKYAQKGLDVAQETDEGRLYPPYILGGTASGKGILWIDRPIFNSGIQLLHESGVADTSRITASQMIDQSILVAAGQGT